MLHHRILFMSLASVLALVVQVRAGVYQQALPEDLVPAVCAEPHTDFEAVNRWCTLVAGYFEPEWIHWAMHIIDCESDGDPDANRDKPGRSHKGLFQHSTRYWDDRARRAGWEGADIYDPEANIAVSAHLLATGGTSHWTCKARHAVP